MHKIHSTATLHSTATIEANVEIGPYAVIGPDVKIGSSTRIGAHTVIFKHTTMGQNNVIFPFAAIGGDPQDLKYRGEPTLLKIGNNNVFREFVTVSRGTEHGSGVTEIGSDNLFMAYSHIAHDCKIKDRTIFANSAALAGHVKVGRGAILGGLCAVHQFVRVGALVLVGGGAMVSQDVPPFCRAIGDRAKLHGLNTIGLKRSGFDDTKISSLKEVYRIIFRSGLRFVEALKAVEESELFSLQEVRIFIDFIRASKRGVCRDVGRAGVGVKDE